MDDLKEVLSKPYSMDILKFLFDKKWVPADQIAKHLNLNLPIAMLYLSDLERVGLAKRQMVTKDEKNIFEYMFSEPPDGFDVSQLEGAKETKISTVEIESISRFYMKLILAIKCRVHELGGVQSVDDIVPDESFEPTGSITRKLIEIIQSSNELDVCLEDLKKRISSGDIDAVNANNVKEGFLEILSGMVEANERFMGKLYGTHVVKASTRSVLIENKALINQYNLLMGLPPDYFKISSD